MRPPAPSAGLRGRCSAGGAPVVEAIVAAAGQGRRFGRPKQFRPLAGKNLIARAASLLSGLPEIRRVVLALPPRNPVAKKLAAKLSAGRMKSRLFAVDGGATRQESVRLALEHISHDADIVLVHDAARPFASREMIKNLIAAAARHGAACPCVPVADTLKLCAAAEPDGTGRIVKTVPRENLACAQTPQAFKRGWLAEAHDRARRGGWQATDDAMLVERLGRTVRWVAGEPSNFKITTPLDWRIAEVLVRSGGKR